MKGEANPIVSAGVLGLSAMFRGRTITPSEALAAHLDRIARLNPGLNALVHLDVAGAEAAAEASSARWRDGQPLSRIDGVPVAVKANIAVQGLPWTGAFVAFKDRVAAADAVIVSRLRAAGAVIVGVANMHEGALGATTDSPLYGKAYNPEGVGLTPGGSSGGSAAAVAAALTPAALGSDTLGSVRVPSSYCGIVGFKPSFGRLSRRGMELLSWSLDHAGVHARSVRDARVLFEIVNGPDADDPWSSSGPIGVSRRMLEGLRVGRLLQDVEVEPEIAASFDAVLHRLTGAGAAVTDVDLRAHVATNARRQGLLIAEAEAAVMLGAEMKAHPDGFSETFRAMVEYGARQEATKLAQAYRAMTLARAAARAAFETCDALVLPATPHVAFPQAQAAPASQADLTAFANLAGLPAISVPMGAGRDGLPCGLQIIGPAGGDALVLRVAELVEKL